MDPIAWRDTMRPIRFYVFDARLTVLATLWLFVPNLWTTLLVLAAAIVIRIAESRGYRLPAVLRAVRAKLAGRRHALHARHVRRFVDFG